MNTPNFFIVGAPKCATTSLHRYLKTHPNVFLPTLKEPCFFCTDFPNEVAVDSMDEYLELFTEASDTDSAIGESSVWYLYSEAAGKKLYEFNPDSKLIIMLRNPVEQVQSMHMQCFIEGYENETDFEKAWRLQESRKSGKNLPSSCSVEQFLQYKDIASYSHQIKRLLNIFPREKIKFILFDDMKANPRQVYIETLEFLGLVDDNKQDFKIEKPSQRYKMKWLADLILNQPEWLVALKRPIKRLLKTERLAIGSFIYNRNIETGKRKPLPSALISELKNEFRDEVNQTSKLINRDLSHWCS